MFPSWNLESECVVEAQRRLTLLGDLPQHPYDPKTLHERARQTLVPSQILWSWLATAKNEGVDALKPNDWTNLPPDIVLIIAERYGQLGNLADVETITEEQIIDLGKGNGWSRRTTIRWLKRYRVGGKWALAPKNNIESSRRQRGKCAPRALATLTESALEEVHTRRQMLGELADKAHVSDAEMKERAKAVGISSRTLWTYRQKYRQHGLAGLAPRQRADLNLHYRISGRMIKIVKGIRLSFPDLPIREVHNKALEKARFLGEVEPSEDQVRDISAEIPDFVKQIADGREDEFRSRSRITYRMLFGSEILIVQIDHTQIDVLVKDQRHPKYRAKSGEIRPWLTHVMVASARLSAARIFSYDRPDRFTVAAAIRDMLIITAEKPYCGLVDEIWVDNGKDLVSRHIQQLTQELGILLQPCAPHQPQLKGIVERFFGTLNTRLWSTLPGYVGSNTTERNPRAKAELTIAEIVDRFDAFIQRYHNEVHSELGMPPLAYWNEHCHAAPVDLRLLDMLLLEPQTRRVIKEGIKYEGRIYWHQEFATLIGQDVTVRAQPHYAAPDEIEVFSDGRWICTAFAIDSPRGQSIGRAQIVGAQQEQRAAARHIIEQARTALKQAEADSAALASDGASKSTQPSDALSKPPSAQPPSSSSQRPSLNDMMRSQHDEDDDEDLFDSLVEA